MCGISGFNFKDEGLIRKMNQKLRHRGPDDEGFFVDQSFSLGQTRLSIIDLSEKGKPPIFNEDRTMLIIHNGEIYNFKDLKKDLISKGHCFYSQTDTEVALHAFEEYGPKCLDLFNGIFALAIYNIKTKELFLARDRLGVKPLYYYWKNNQFIFSSEIKAILEHSIAREINRDSLNHYFRLGFTPQPLTIFKDIHKLPSAHYLVLKDNNFFIKRYWQIDNFADIKSEKEIIEQIQFLVKNAINLQLVSDRPIGLYLSGGIDSSVLAGLVGKLYGEKLNTFSVGFNQGQKGRFNADFYLAEKTSRYFKTTHHKLIITGQDLGDNLEKVIYHLDEPISNTPQTAEFLLAQSAKQNVAVVLTGAGGDELFGGYPRYYFNHLIDRFQSSPLYFLAKFILPVISRFYKKNLIDKFTALNLSRYRQFMFRKEEEINKFIRPEINNNQITGNFYQEKFFNNLPEIGSDFTKYFMLVDMSTWMVDLGLINSDKMSMAFGLEQRVPFLDHRLVELSARIPTSLKIKGKKTKWIFKKAMADYLPNYVLSAPKRGFLAPASERLRHELKPLAEKVFSKNYCPEAQEYFNGEEIQKMFRNHINKKSYHLNALWSLLTFLIWHKIYIK